MHILYMLTALVLCNKRYAFRTPDVWKCKKGTGEENKLCRYPFSNAQCFCNSANNSAPVALPATLFHLQKVTDEQPLSSYSYSQFLRPLVFTSPQIPVLFSSSLVTVKCRAVYNTIEHLGLQTVYKALPVNIR